MAQSAPAFRIGSFAATEDITLYVREFGDRTATTTPLVCLHGYWRTSRDFEELGAHLAPTRRVITPDLRGRGRSGRSTDEKDYEFERLIDDVERLMAQMDISRAVFLGTALGAHIFMRLNQTRPDLFAGFIFNDTAPESPPAAGAKAGTFSGGDERTYEEAYSMIRAQNEKGFTRYGDEDFHKMTRRAYWQNKDGNWVRDFDQLTNKDISRVMAIQTHFWNEYRELKAPIAILRGENSDFLTPELAKRMLDENPNATLYTIEGCGHPPMLWEPESFAAIETFLARVDQA